MNNPLILAVDTSCDDTSASVMRGDTILSNIIASQTELHKPYGGVFPTVAKQAHKENIKPTVATALKRARVTFNELDALAVTVGPGLAPALEVGLKYMKELSVEINKPLIGVNHIEGHALSAIAKQNSKEDKDLEISYPVLSIIVSGGHTQFVQFSEIGKYKIIGTSLDDAVGECLDKIGRMLNLGYPAGATIEKFAKLGNEKTIKFPLPMTTVKTFDMSFSGLKTFARNYIEDHFGESTPNKQDTYDFCASAQYGVFRHIMYKLNKYLELHQISEVWLGGGVAANTKLRQMIRETIKDYEPSDTSKNPNIIFRTPFTNRLCMDNAAMIGLVASYKYQRKEFVTDLESLDRIPRWKIDSQS